jgi:hypothetical protein
MDWIVWYCLNFEVRTQLIDSVVLNFSITLWKINWQAEARYGKGDHEDGLFESHVIKGTTSISR